MICREKLNQSSPMIGRDWKNYCLSLKRPSQIIYLSAAVDSPLEEGGGVGEDDEVAMGGGGGG